MKYRKKPVVIDAFQWTGGLDQIEDPLWIVEALKKGKESFGPNTARIVQINPGGPIGLEIFTLEGRMMARLGDYVIKGVRGEIYPCRNDIFEETYDPEPEAEREVMPDE